MALAMIEFDRKQREDRERAEEALKSECDAYRRYVEEKSQVYAMRSHRRKMDTLIEEERRAEQRRHEKAHRYAERLRGCEEKERVLMSQEDGRSLRLREYHLELQCELSELTNMRKQEHVQTMVDAFWGIDLAERLRREEEERRRRAYEALVEDLRVTCVKVKIVRPTEVEAKKRVYRDRITGEVLQ
jgi:hypothetical protein